MSHQKVSAGPYPRVGLNAHLLSLGDSYRGAGLSRYIYNLLIHLPHVDRELDYLALVGEPGMSFPGWQQSVSRWGTASPAARIAWEQLAQPWRARRARLDLLHAPAYVGPLMVSCPVVVTIHDLSFCLYPELFKPFNRYYLQLFTRQTTTRAAHVIAVSASTRADATRVLGIPAEQITVIPNGVDEDMQPLTDRTPVEALRRRYQLPEHIILFLGTLEPRKNVPRLLEAYALLCNKPGFTHRLVIAGGKGWYYDEIDATIERLGLSGQVILPGFVPRQDLVAWYNAADVFVYPSLYEGFGLPPLEAMACGTPVIVSNRSSLPEVVGDAGVLVEPDDPQALAEEIANLLDDPARRHLLRQAGLLRARGYSWYRTAKQTSTLYRQVLGAQP